MAVCLSIFLLGEALRMVACSGLNERLSGLMKDRAVSLTMLHRGTGVPLPTLKRLQSDPAANPTIGILLPVARFFGVTVDQLVGEAALVRVDPDESWGQHYIRMLDLQKYPAGGYYKSVYRSELNVVPYFSLESQGLRSSGSGGYFLLQKGAFHAWSRKKSDEIWYFHDGGPVKVYYINEVGKLVTKILGNPVKMNDAMLQISIKRNTWVAAELADRSFFCLFGCSVFPGFEFGDFELGDPVALSNEYPHAGNFFLRFSEKIT